MELSLAEQLAELEPGERETVLSGLSDIESDGLLSDWDFLARPKQKPPQWDWLVWLVLAGRGFGKTRTGAEMVRKWKEDFPIIHLIGPTAGDVRDVMVEGPAGIMKLCLGAKYEPSKRKITFDSGAIAKMFSADEPERLRGPQCHKAWADEPAAWRYAEAWDQMMFGLRLGSLPQVVATTTPKPIPLIRDLVTREGIDVAITRGSTRENMMNLAETFLRTVVRKYQGTRLGRQELDAEILEDVEGALWTLGMIEAARVRENPPMDLVVVGVDPPAKDRQDEHVTEEEKLLNAECGIVVVGMPRPMQTERDHGKLPHAYVVGDYSMQGRPEEWARAVVDAYYLEGAHLVVAEGNQGGAMVRSTIHNVDPNVPVQLVFASKGKRTRAEPISAIYEQGRMHHVGFFPYLEAQMTTWVPGEKSPDRMDALVWAATKLLIGIPRSVGQLAGRNR